ncbi:VPLPA-CTERM sorting domain-containing protein [Pseudooceanicola sp. LIPI14-2-Ac024]|uniref:VPLPA-CTERM sorting domain-containing protein n=1 Tax=Pseudooceanicola sp. LIPI14-2-Ac024 TaxID=3344875 RepID=UPI0035CE97EF
MFRLNTVVGAALGAAISVTLATGAHATILTIYDGVAAGASDFDSTVTGAGGTVSTDVWTGLSSSASIDRGDYVITQNDGGVGGVANYGSLSGQVIGINPAGGGSSPRTDPLDYFGSGITFTFDNPVNAIGFEVGDWATCCHAPVTELFISFDGGAPILVGSATSTADGLFPSQDTGASVFEIFVAAFDNSDDFTTVSFWGNGIGEVLYAGGQVKYSLLSRGSLPPATPEIPLPAGGLLLLTAFGAIGAAARRRKA